VSPYESPERKSCSRIKRNNSDRLFKLNHIVPEFGLSYLMSTPGDRKKSMDKIRHTEKIPVKPKEKLGTVDEGHFSFGGSSKEETEFKEEMLNDREQLRKSIMSL